MIFVQNKLGLSCPKLRASLNFFGLDYILVYFDWLTWFGFANLAMNLRLQYKVFSLERLYPSSLVEVSKSQKILVMNNNIFHHRIHFTFVVNFFLDKKRLFSISCLIFLKHSIWVIIRGDSDLKKHKISCELSFFVQIWIFYNHNSQRLIMFQYFIVSSFLCDWNIQII